MGMIYTPIPFEFLEEMEELTDEEYGRLIRWGQRYQSTGEVTELTGNERFFAKRMQMQIDRFVDHYTEVSRKRSEAGRMGGRQKAANACLKFGKFVELTQSDYNSLLGAMGSSAFVKCRFAVDREDNVGKDWYDLIMEEWKRENAS